LLFLGCSLVKDRFLDVLAAVVARQRSIVNFAVLERPASGDEFAARTRWLSMIGVRPLWFPKGRFDVIGPLLEHVVREARLVPTVSAEQRAEQETVRISAEIEAALDRKQALLDANVTTTSVEQEILALKRRLRETGQVRAGDSLSGGRYLLVRTLGSGGFATVWEAEDRHEKRRVAIKILHPMIATDQQRRERFLRGARTMQSLKHDSIVKVFDPDGQDGGILFLVMELAAGGDLRRFALEHPFEPSEALALIGQVGSALAFAHDAGLVHRDVKPANILLTGDRRPMLTDFDLVGGQHTTGGTRTGALGTFVYAAPELMSKPQDATAAADVYGLAATAVFLLSRADLPLLFVRDSSAVIKTLPCSPAVKAVLSHATAWEPAMRHADAREFCEDLRNPPAVLDPDARKSLRFVSGKYQGGECPLRQGSTVVIGRSSELDMVLVEDMVSRRHARITVSDQIVVEDLGSVNGTFVNGEKVKRASLQEGDRILIGTSIMKLVVWADEPDAVEEDDGFGSTRPRPLL
jgi:serine/threonine protein kinase